MNRPTNLRFFSALAGLLLFAGLFSASAQKRKTPPPPIPESLPAVVVVSVKHGDNIPAAIERKVDAAFALALFASEKFRAIPFAVRDSALTELRTRHADVTAAQLAGHLGAAQAAFVTVNRLNNILRVAVSCRRGQNFGELTEGVGYAVLKYRKGSQDSILYDPPLLQAVQRAFAAAQGDSMMYRRADADMRVFPAKLLVPTHLEFVEKFRTASPMFEAEKKAVVAYDAVQTIFTAAKDHPLYVPLDVDTRDSVYALANLFEVENANPPNVLELKVLYQLEVRHCILSALTQETVSDLTLTMKLCEITPDGNLRLLRNEKTALGGDKIADLQKALKHLTRKILRER
jgi:hypothetical protein